MRDKVQTDRQRENKRTNVSDITRQVYNLFQDLWNRLIILEGLVKGAKPLWCQGFADRQAYRTGSGARFKKVDTKECKTQQTDRHMYSTPQLC